MRKLIQFTKMHGLGNDFVVIDAINQALVLNKMIVGELANRHLGIGFDQLLLIEKSQTADFFCRIFNADGSEAEQCGNGIRCVARFLHEEQLNKNKKLTVQTKAGIFEIVIHSYDKIEVNMGIPQFEPHKIPVLLEEAGTFYNLQISPDTILPTTILSMGNPHAILQASSLKSFEMKEVAEKIATLAAFPEGVNIGFMEIQSPSHISLRTFERGTGETYACGSNACAAVVAGIRNSWLNSKVTVQLAHGNLLVEWQGNDEPVKLTGPATRVFTGQIDSGKIH